MGIANIGTVLISVCCSLFAVYLAHLFASSRNKKNDLTKFQIQSYSDFLAAASRLAVLRRVRRDGDLTNDSINLAALNDAKSRIITCGDPDVVQSLMHFWDNGATLEREPEILAYRNLTQVMRSSLGFKKNDLLRIDFNEGYKKGKNITDVLFKLEPSSYSFKAEKDGQVLER
jgi:hypothetical protein